MGSMRPAGPRHPPSPMPLWPIVKPGTDGGSPDSRCAREIPTSFSSTLPSSSFQPSSALSGCQRPAFCYAIHRDPSKILNLTQSR
jgi:hypothetical protein